MPKCFPWWNLSLQVNVVSILQSVPVPHPHPSVHPRPPPPHDEVPLGKGVLGYFKATV